MSNKNQQEWNAIKGKQPMETQFMGTQKGATIDEVRAVIKQQKRIKGFEFVLPTGASTFDLQISGTARIFLGFALLNVKPADPTATPENFTFTINNEVIIDKVKPFFFTNYLMDDEYYFIPRPLSGTDQIKVDFQNATAPPQTWWMILYYI
jgi:hypothetical protein